MKLNLHIICLNSRHYYTNEFYSYQAMYFGLRECASLLSSDEFLLKYSHFVIYDLLPVIYFDCEKEDI